MNNILEKLAVTSAVFLAVSLGGISKSLAIVFTGDTTGQPTWNRPVQGNPPTNLSLAGTAVPYSVQEFFVDTNGAYNFLSTTIWDNFTFLYASAFNPTAPFTNVIIGNDDFPTIGISGFNGVNLTANQSYFFVTTGFANSDFGTFTNEITGPGTITLGSPTPVPFDFSPNTSVFILAGAYGVKRLLMRRKPVKLLIEEKEMAVKG
ncbi:hypothetical protein [Nodularia chucula]|uniref:PFE-CTERM domain-containing protein n=1 Tax=Nodularia chucula TaxID=3093667 RepID=UPI0039C6AEF0